MLIPADGGFFISPFEGKYLRVHPIEEVALHLVLQLKRGQLLCQFLDRDRI